MGNRSHDTEVLNKVGSICASIASVGINGDGTIFEGLGHWDANCFFNVRDVVFGALVAVEDDLGRGRDLILVVLAVRDVFGLGWKGQLIGGGKTDVFIGLLEDSFVSFGTLRASRFSSVEGNVIVLIGEDASEIEVRLTEGSAEFFTKSIVVLGVSVQTSVAFLSNVIEGPAKLVVVDRGLIAFGFVDSSEGGVVFEIESGKTDVALRERFSLN